MNYNNHKAQQEIVNYTYRGYYCQALTIDGYFGSGHLMKGPSRLIKVNKKYQVVRC